jgi:hypothetical protein
MSWGTMQEPRRWSRSSLRKAAALPATHTTLTCKRPALAAVGLGGGDEVMYRRFL